MARGKPVSVELRKLIINWHDAGKSYGQIAKEIYLPRPTVVNIIKHFKKIGSVDSLVNKRGRKSQLTTRDYRVLNKIVKKKPKIDGS